MSTSWNVTRPELRIVLRCKQSYKEGNYKENDTEMTTSKSNNIT
jgi:hypothetical protein